MSEYELKPFDKAVLDAKAIAAYWSMVAFALENRKCSLNKLINALDRILDLQEKWLNYERAHIEEFLEELPKD